MGTQLKRLTAPRAWDPEAVQADSARNVEANHVVSHARLQLPRRFRRPPRPREEKHVWPWQAKRDPGRHRPLCPQLSPWGRPLPYCGFGAWRRQVPHPNLKTTIIRDPLPKPKHASIPNPAFEPHTGMGSRFSPQGRSQDRRRFGSGDVPGPNPNPT